jgi:putative DNA primase/helicase
MRNFDDHQAQGAAEPDQPEGLWTLDGWDPGEPPPRDDGEGESESKNSAGVELIRADTVPPEAVQWLWDGWLARGKLQIAAGAPGTGKTTVALAIAATITSGGQWPDGATATQGRVLIWSGEDGVADTLVPRLAAAGADLSRVHFVGCVDGRPFDPAIDSEKLAQAAEELGDVVLLIVDPIVNAVAGDGNRNAEVRRGLQPLVDLAAKLRTAVLGISHFSKGTAGRDPVERVTGSIAFGALARIVFGTAKMPEEKGGGHVFCRAKANIGPDGDGFSYDLVQADVPGVDGLTASIVRWGEFMEGQAREILAQAEALQSEDCRAALQEAKAFLCDTLELGPVPKTEIVEKAEAEGISYATLRRAKAALKITSEKRGFGRAAVTYWILQKGDLDDTGSTSDK